MLRFVEVQALLLGPICPHTCEHIWGNLLKRDGLLVRTPLPAVEMTAEHQNTVMAGRYLQDTVTSLRKLVQKLETPKKAKGGKAAEAPPKVDTPFSLRRVPATREAMQRATHRICHCICPRGQTLTCPRRSF